MSMLKLKNVGFAKIQFSFKAWSRQEESPLLESTMQLGSLDIPSRKLSAELVFLIVQLMVVREAQGSKESGK